MRGVLPYLKYYRTDERGISRARNAGLRAASGGLIAFTDDDCTVEPDWLQQVAAVFARNPAATFVCGSVTAAPHDWRAVVIPRILQQPEHAARRRLAHLRSECMGASLSMRRELALEIGPFDVHLGAGAEEFKSGEDLDYLYRVRTAGKTVVWTPAAAVEHHGARDFASGAGSRIAYDSAYGLGAADMKALRCGDPAAWLVIPLRLGTYILRVDLRGWLTRRAPSNLGWPAWYLKGLVGSFRLGVDRHTRLYRARTAQW